MLRPENHLIAFEASELPTGPWLVFAPHADDETFGMGGSLIKARHQGIDAHVIVLADGALGGVTADLVAVRQREVREAAKLLGVASLECWNEPDRGIEPDGELVKRIADTITGLQPASVFFPGPLELHPDHRATALAVWSALQSLDENVPTAFAYEISVQNPVNTLIDISHQKEGKEKVMAVYASQNSENNYIDLVLALNVTRTFTLPAEITHAEGYYRFREEDLELSLAEVTRRICARYLDVSPS